MAELDDDIKKLNSKETPAEETPAEETTAEAAPVDEAETPADPAAEPAEDLLPTDYAAVPLDPAKAKKSWPRRVLAGYWRKKFLTIPLTIILLAVAIVLVPATRYPVLGLFLKTDFTVRVLDASTKKPVSKAQVTISGVVGQTDAQGNVKLRLPVGKGQLQVAKKYFKTTTADVLVDVKQKNAPYTVPLTATGRQVPLTVVSKLTGKPIAGATVTAAGTEAKTDKDGKATIVLPADKKTVDVTITAAGMNELTGTLQVQGSATSENVYQLVSAGNLYFLSKLSGKIDVVKTNLDGSDRQTVLAGTGKESGTDTILLASRDWKYLVLKSKRDGGENPKLFLIDTTTDKQTTMDEGKADFTLIGWSNHRFVYQVDREGKQYWEPKAQALKSFDADTAKLTTIDETDGEGTNNFDYKYTRFNATYILDNELVYAKYWNANYSQPNPLDGKNVSLTSVRPDGSAKKTIKDFPVPPATSYYSISLSLYEPQEIYVGVNNPDGGKATYYEYEDGKIAAKPDVSDEDFNKPYPTYLVSPSGKKAFWFEARDGKNVMFVGDSNGANGKQVASLSEYTAYGWYSEDYLLLSKKSSELYILPVAGGNPLKVTDYHKPDYDFRGYGGGYGGL